MSRSAMAMALVIGMVAVCGGAAPTPPNDARPAFNSRLRIPDAAWSLGKNTAVLSQDGKWVFSTRFKDNKLSLAVFSAATGAFVRELPTGGTELRGVASVALSTDGKVAAAAVNVPSTAAPLGGAYEIRIWDFASGRERPSLTGFKMESMRIALSADGRWLSSSCGWVGGKEDPFPCEVRLFDLGSGKPVFSVNKVDGMEYDATVSPDGKTFVWIAGKTLHVWDIRSMKERATATLPPRLDFEEIGISPDGQTMVTAGQHLAIIWDLPGVKPRRSIIIERIGGGRPAFTRDSKLMAIPFYEKAIFFDTHSGQAIGALVAERPRYVPRSISLSGDGAVLLTMQGDGKTAGVHLFDATKLDPPPALRDADGKTLSSEAPLSVPGTDEIGTRHRIQESDAKVGGTGVPPATGASDSGSAAASKGSGSGNSSAPATGTGKAVHPPPSNTTDPIAFVGAWTGMDGPFRVTWTIVRKDQSWTISAVYIQGNLEHGSAHAENVGFTNGVLSFTRVFDKKPQRDFATDAAIVMELKDGRISFTATSGTKTKHLLLHHASEK